MMITKNIFELERRVKEVYARDKTDPELYEALRDLAAGILVYKKMVYRDADIEEISHALATDYYMAISRGEIEIRCWTKYIYLRLFTYRGNYYDATNKICVQVDDLTDAQQLASDLATASEFQFSRMTTFETEDMIKNFPVFIVNQLAGSIRYRKGSAMHNNVKITVLLNMANHRSVDDTVMFKCDESLKYIKFLSELAIKKLETYSNALIDTRTSVGEVAVEDIAAYRSIMT